MTPEVLAWDDASNNRLLASGRGSWIHNPISAYRTIEGQNKELADKIFVPALAQGPGRRGAPSPTAWPTASPSSRTNQDGAKLFLEALTDNFPEAFKASTGYNNPFLKTYAKGAVADHQRGPQAEGAREGAEYHYTIGYPGPLTVPADEVYQQFMLIDAARAVLHGQDGPRADGQVGRGQDQGDLRQVRLAAGGPVVAETGESLPLPSGRPAFLPSEPFAWPGRCR